MYPKKVSLLSYIGHRTGALSDYNMDTHRDKHHNHIHCTLAQPTAMPQLQVELGQIKSY